MILNATTEYRVVSCIAFDSRQLFKRRFHLDQINVITGASRQRRAQAIALPLNPVLIEEYEAGAIFTGGPI